MISVVPLGVSWVLHGIIELIVALDHKGVPGRGVT